MRTGDLGTNAERLRDVVQILPAHWTLLDVGVRDGVSSDIMLEHGDSPVIGIDVNECPPHLVDHPRYRFLQGDSVTRLADLCEPFGLVFFDTLHIAEQVMCELYFTWHMIPVGGWAVFHDTAWPEWKRDHYLGRDWDRPEAGVARFFRDNPSVEITTHEDSFGMTFVRKLAYVDLRGGIDWAPVFAARNQLLALLPETTPRRVIVP